LWIYVRSGAEQGIAYFDLSDQTTQAVAGSSTTPTNLTIEDVGNGWYRCSATFDNTTATTSGTGVGVSDAKGNDSVTAGKSVYIWGAQLEAQSQVTSYTATSGSTATRSADVYTTATKQRSADVCYIDGTAFTDFYNQDEGTILVDAKLPDGQGSAGGQENYFIQIDDGTYNNRIEFDRLIADNIRFRISQNGTSYTENTSGTYVDGSDVKVAFAFVDSSFRGYINGSDVAENTSIIMPSGLNKFSIGNNGPNVTQHFNGSFRKIIYFPRKLTPDTQLEKLTQ
jgi:hypothetical protein